MFALREKEAEDLAERIWPRSPGAARVFNASSAQGSVGELRNIDNSHSQVLIYLTHGDTGRIFSLISSC